jgi:RNA polymerase sigma-70 factor, ECF subfamily
MPISEMSDEEIIVKLQGLTPSNPDFNSVEKRYAEEIYNRYYKQAYYLSRYYGLSHNDAEDAAQESFIKLFRNIRSFNAELKFKPWFLKLVFNKVKDRYGSLKKNRYKDLEETEETEAGNDNRPHDKIIEKFHVQEFIGSIIDRLPLKYKKVILLRIYGEMKFEDIAESTGVSVRQVRNRLDKALGLVKAALEEKKWIR